MKSVMYLKEKIKNTERKFGSINNYYPCIIVSGDKEYMSFFTKSQVLIALKRAKQNPEDINLLFPKDDEIE